ncbi:MAG: DNA polymerase III subunit delta [Burkholderiales bacterium]
MRVSTEQLARELQRGLKPLYTVVGGEPLLALEAADRIRAAARAAGHTDREILVSESGFDWKRLAMAGREQSLFATRTLVEVRIPTGKPGVEGAAALQAFCADLPSDTLALVTLPGLDWRALKAEWVAALDRAGVLVEAQPIARTRLPEWLKARFELQDQQPADDAVAFIADRVEGNLLAAFQEVQKLALLFPPGRLTLEQVRGAVTNVARYDVFDLGPVALAGDARAFLRMLEGLRGEGAPPTLVLWSLAEAARGLARAQQAQAAGLSGQSLWREAKVWNRALQDALGRAMRRIDPAVATAALAHAARIDRIVKGLAGGNAWDEFARLGLRFAQGPAQGLVAA